MKEYKYIHGILTRKVAEKILIEKDIKINFINRNNFALAWLTIWVVFFVLLIMTLIYKSWFINYIDWSDKTIYLLQGIFSFIWLLLLFTIVIFWYILYFYNLILLIKKRKSVWLNTIYRWKLLLLIVFVIVSIPVWLLSFFNAELLSYIIENWFKYLIYWYFWIFFLSMFIFFIEYILKNKKNYSDFYVLGILTLFKPTIWYLFLTKIQRKLIENWFTKVKKNELDEINKYLIYGNKIENNIRRIIFWTWLFYVIMKLIIGDFWLDYEKIQSFIINNTSLSIVLFLLFIVSLLVFRIFFTPSFIRWAYYVYLKENNKINI